MKYEYLLFNLVILISPIIASLGYRGFIYPKLIPTSISISIVGLVFIIWDMLVTNIFWYFNSEYILGIFISNLPIEEILFFITVPFSTLVLWVNVKNFNSHTINIALIKVTCLAVVFTVSMFSLITVKYYTFIVTFIMLFIILFYVKERIAKVTLVFFLIISVLILIFNGYLTARPIVMYNPLYNLGVNILTIPVEDFIYGYILIIGVIKLYELIEKRYEK